MVRRSFLPPWLLYHVSGNRTVGLWRYKIEDFVPSLEGTLLGVEGKLGNTDM